jgi:quercetin dioxygenase-like cupin family protein
MKIASVFALSLIGLSGFPSFGLAEGTTTVIAPGDVKWGPAPKVLPAGAEAALLFGDPSKEGMFALRLKVPAGYAIAPHAHPANEGVTVISGTTLLGMGEKADKSAAKALPAGSFFALPSGTQHFVFFDEETVLQINTTGPWGLKYINPADDPQKTQ